MQQELYDKNKKWHNDVDLFSISLYNEMTYLEMHIYVCVIMQIFFCAYFI